MQEEESINGEMNINSHIRRNLLRWSQNQHNRRHEPQYPNIPNKELDRDEDQTRIVRNTIALFVANCVYGLYKT